MRAIAKPCFPVDMMIELRVSASVPTDDELPAGRRARSIYHVWDATIWAKLLTLRGHTHSVNDIAFSQDSRRLVSLSLLADHIGTRFWGIKR